MCIRDRKYGVVFTNGVFQLTSTNTACLALDKCGIPSLENSKEKVQQDCTPGGGCCWLKIYDFKRIYH